MKEKTKVVVIQGPTSSGKSELAIRLAHDLGGEVISADSRQIYRDMNLGTGKVTGSWQKNNGGKFFVSESVIHHLLDFRSPRGEYNVSHFKKDCEKLIDDVTKRGKLPIICGGTGFWIASVVDNLDLPQVKPDKKLRKRLAGLQNQQLVQILNKYDPARAKEIDRDNKIRLIRAIEISKQLGKVPKLIKKKRCNYHFLLIGIDWPQEKLDQKIKKRLESRWTAGMIKEVELLRKKYKLSWKRIQSFGLGYFWIPKYLQGKINLEQLKERVFRAERGYAKRQRTWLKRDERIIWENRYSQIKKLVDGFLEN